MKVLRLLSAAASIVLVIGCSASPGSSGRSRDFKSTTEPYGNRHPVKADINANGTITCVSAMGKGTPACYINTTSGGYQVVTAGQSVSTGTGGTMILACQGSGALACVVNIKD
ncbi:hypothetical protein SAMN05421770_106203 [Granulicella rosea]|uniref:Uncharacterized protein n=2 Tax=Granulicella rosea TaxID=474952 RepID=A0A239L948_9BACT|nr:hypothetical protein SAMN05421770_106203 [Granulicella rosea]